MPAALSGAGRGALTRPSDRCACKCVPVCALVLGRLRGKARQEGERKGSWGGREELVGAPPKGPWGLPGEDWGEGEQLWAEGPGDPGWVCTAGLGLTLSREEAGLSGSCSIPH